MDKLRHIGSKIYWTIRIKIAGPIITELRIHGWRDYAPSNGKWSEKLSRIVGGGRGATPVRVKGG